VLALDSAGSSCSAVVAAGEVIISAKRVATEHGQTERLLPMVDAVMRDARLAASALDIIGTTIGPGSFTGIRVGLAAAHGIALATHAQLIGVTGFEAVAAQLAHSAHDPCAGFLLIALESRREELYIQVLDPERSPLGDPVAVMPASLDEALAPIIGAAPLVIAGDAAPRASRMLSRCPGSIVIEGSAPNAIGVSQAVLRRWRLGRRSPDALPLYLRSPDVTISTVRP
jgi:tRNA threonylcarbamoyladenosine biosynthesis protein TsaB